MLTSDKLLADLVGAQGNKWSEHGSPDGGRGVKRQKLKQKRGKKQGQANKIMVGGYDELYWLAKKKLVTAGGEM